MIIVIYMCFLTPSVVITSFGYRNISVFSVESRNASIFIAQHPSFIRFVVRCYCERVSTYDNMISNSTYGKFALLSYGARLLCAANNKKCQYLLKNDVG